MIVRYASAITTGTFMTFALLFVMQSLVALQPGVVTPPRERFIVDWRKPPPPPPPAQSQKPIQRNQLTKVIIPPRLTTGSGTGQKVGVRFPATVTGENTYTYTPQQYVDGPLAAIVRVSPTYPPSMNARGLEGYVVVRFDVLSDGSVANVVVVESSHSGFNKAAIKAAERFKFKPRVVDGVPLASTGIQNLFRFRMDDE